MVCSSIPFCARMRSYSTRLHCLRDVRCLWYVAFMRAPARTHTHHLIWWMGNYSVGIPHTARRQDATENCTKNTKEKEWEMKITWDSGFIAVFVNFINSRAPKRRCLSSLWCRRGKNDLFALNAWDVKIRRHITLMVSKLSTDTAPRPACIQYDYETNDEEKNSINGRHFYYRIRLLHLEGINK